MTDDVYQLALEAVRTHLRQAGVNYREDEGDLIIGDHRLGLSVGFEGFARQGDQAIAPLDVRLHLDGDEGDRFRVGTLGVGRTQEAALKSAVDEWQMLAVVPLLAALGVEGAARRRTASSLPMGSWRVFPGRAGLRGTVPPGLQAGGDFYSMLLSALREEVLRWPSPRTASLKSIFIMLSAAGDAAEPAGSAAGEREAQAAIDGFVSQSLTDRIGQLPWPSSGEAYFYKQLFVLRQEE